MRIPFTDIGRETGQGAGSEKTTVAKLEELYRDDDAVRKQLEPMWMTNILWLAGNQKEQATNDALRWSRNPVPTPHTKVDIVANKIYPRFRQAAASTVANLNQSLAIPVTDDPEDVQAGELSTTLLRSRYHTDNEEDRRTVETMWMMSAACMRMVWFDPELDSEIPSGGSVVKIPGAGDIANTTVNPFRYHLPHFAEPSEPLPYVILSDVRDVDEVKAMFPGKADEIKEADSAVMTANLDRLLTSIVDGSAGAGSATTKRKHAVILKRMYCAPTAKYPDGRYYVWTEGALLQESDLPEGELLMYHGGWCPMPGSLYDLPFTTPLIGMQKEFNITLRQLIELRNRQLRGDVIYKGASPIVQEIDPKTGAKRIRVPLDGSDFQLMQYNLNTGEGKDLMQLFKDDMDDTSGVHQPTMGADIQGDPTLGQINILQSADMGGLSFFGQRINRLYCRVDSAKLLIAQNHFDLPRVLRDVGRGQLENVMAFRGADLRGIRDVRPAPTPVITETQKMALRAKAAELGLYDLTGTPEQKLGKVRAMLSLGLPTDEVEEHIAPMSIQELQQMAGEFSRDNIMLAIAAQKAQMMQIQQAMAPPEQETAIPGPGGTALQMINGGMAPQ